MSVRSTLIIGTVLSGSLTVTDAHAGLFVKRSCRQVTPNVCTQSCIPVGGMATIPPSECSTVVCCSDIKTSSPVVPQIMFKQSFEETYTVQVPYTETQTVDGRTKTVTKMRTETKTRIVERDVTVQDFVKQLESQIAALRGQNRAQDDRLERNDGTDKVQSKEIDLLKKK